MSKTELMSEGQRKKIIAALDKREDSLRAAIRSVAQGYTSAAFVWGPGGLGKTHLITTELSQIHGTAWKHHTSVVTPKALMMSIADWPASVHLFEDCESLYKAEAACSILRAACGAPKQKERWVTYETAHEKLSVNFSGGIVIVSNQDLSRAKGPLAAVASRFRPIKWDLSAEERIAKILTIAQSGWAKGEWLLTPGQCKTVALFLVEEMSRGEVTVPVDLRTYTEHCLPAFAQSLDKSIRTDWKELIRTKLAGQVNRIEKRDERGDRLEALALAIHLDSKLDAKAKIFHWKMKTGLGQAIYYRHLKKAKAHAQPTPKQ